ncbi:unnamed protein product [Tilletia laevis]|nr:unnamed protein product [Tilletia laevis]CAD6929354.1 unnamed protein product [Tilletia caries]
MEAVQPAPSSSSSAHPAAPAPAQASYPDVGEGPAWLTTDRRTQLEALRATIHRACFAATSANDAIRHLRDVYRQVEFGNQAPVRVHGQPPSLDSAPRPGSVSSRVRWRPRTDGDDVLFSDEDEDWILSSGDEMESNADADAGAGVGAQPETERRTRIPARLVGRLTMLADELRDALELVDVDSLTSPGGDVDVGRGLTAAVATATTRAAAAASAASSSGEMVNASTTSNSTPSLRTNAIEVAQGRNGEAQLRTMLARNGIAADLIERYVAAFRALQTSSSSQPGIESSTDSGTMATAILFSAVNLLQGTTFEAVSSGLAFSTSTAAAAGDPAPAGAAEPEREASMRQHLTMVGASAQRIALAVLAFRRAPSSSASASGSASASAPVAGSSSAAAAAAITPREETLQNGEVNMRIALTEQGYDAARIERHAQAYRSLTTGTGGSSRTAGSAPTTSTVTPFASRRVGGGGGGADVGATPFGATPVGTPASSSRNAAGAVDTEASTRSGNDSTRDARFTTHPQLFTFGAGARARGTAGEAGSSGETFPFSFQLPARTAVATSSSPSALPAAAGDGDDGQLTPLGRWSRIHELADRGQGEDSIRAALTSTNGGTSSAPRPTAGGSTASSSEYWRARRSSLARSRGRRLRPGSTAAAAAGEPGHRPDINFVARMPASVVAGGGGEGSPSTSMPASTSSPAPVPAPNPASVHTSASSDLPTSSSTSGSTTAVASGPSSGDVGPEPTAITNLLRSLGDETLRSTSAYASAVAVFGNAATVLAEDAAVLRGRPRQLQIQLLNNIIDMLNIRRELTRRQLEDVENPSGNNDGGAASATTTSSTSPPSGSRTTLAAALRLYQDTVNRFERTRTELERGTAARREEERALLRERELTVQAQRAALTASHIASRDRAVNASNAGSGSAGATRAQPTEQRLAPGERWNSLAGGTCPMCRSAISGFNVDCDPLPRGRSTTTTATGESASPFTLGLTSSSMSTTTAIVNGRSTTASSSRDRLAPIRALRGLRFSVGIPADQADFIQSSAMAAAMAAEEVERDADTAEPAAKRVKREFGDAPFRGLGKANGKVPESINPRLTTTDAAGFSRPVPSPAGVGAAATATATDATPATINPSRRDDAMTAAGAVARSEDSIAGAVLADVVLEAAAPAQPASSSRRALAPNVLHGQTQDGSSSTAAIVLDDDSDDLNDELDAVVMVAATVDLLAARRERELPSSENDPLSPLNHVRTPGFAPSGGAQLAPLPAREESGGIAVGESSSAPNRNEEQVAGMRLLRRPGSGTVGVSAAGASSSSSSSSSITPLASRTGSDEDGAESAAANGNNAAPLTTRPRKRRRTADDDGEEDRLVDEAIRYGHLPSI